MACWAFLKVRLLAFVSGCSSAKMAASVCPLLSNTVNFFQARWAHFKGMEGMVTTWDCSVMGPGYCLVTRGWEPNAPHPRPFWVPWCRIVWVGAVLTY